MNNAFKKKEIRAQFLLQREALPAEVCQRKSRKISQRLLASSEFKAARWIHFYLSTPAEVQTEEMIREALRLKKQVAVPVVGPRKGWLTLSELVDFNSHILQPGPFGILQPRPHFQKEVKPDEIDLWVIPGVAFDKTGNRLGFGGGYYDRLLGQAKREVIGLAFEFQVVDRLPVDGTDRPVDQIITERRRIFCRGERGGGETN